MNKARSNPLNTAAMHGALILCTLIARFPVFVILINSFKERQAILRVLILYVIFSRQLIPGITSGAVK